MFTHIWIYMYIYLYTHIYLHICVYDIYSETLHCACHQWIRRICVYAKKFFDLYCCDEHICKHIYICMGLQASDRESACKTREATRCMHTSASLAISSLAHACTLYLARARARCLSSSPLYPPALSPFLFTLLSLVLALSFSLTHKLTHSPSVSRSCFRRSHQRACICVWVCVGWCVCIWLCARVHMHICIYIYIYIYTYI